MHRAASTFSPKVIASAVATFAMGVALAIVLALIDHPEQLAGLPSWLRFLVIAGLPAVASGLAGYAKRDPLRDLGAEQLDQAAPLRRVE